MTDRGRKILTLLARPAPYGLNFRIVRARWRYAGLWRLVLLAILVEGTPAQAQSSGKYPIFGLQFSPDGKYLAAAASSNDPPGPIVIWDSQDWTVFRVHLPAKGSLDVDFSPDGTKLAYGSKAGVVGILDVASGELLREIKAHTNAVYSVAFSPNGESLASAGADRSIKLWNLSSGELVRRFDGHADVVYGVAISADGKLLLSGAGDHQARLWNVETGAITKTFSPGDLIVRRVAFSRDGEYFLVSTWDGKTRIRETATGKLRAMLASGSNCADLTADNRLAATSGRGSSAEVFAVDLQVPTPEVQSRIASLISKFQNDSYELRESAAQELAKIGMAAERQLREAVSHDDAETRVQARHLLEKVLSPEPVARLAGHRGDVEVVCFSAAGRLLATACRGGDIKIWDGTSFAELKTLDFPATSK